MTLCEFDHPIHAEYGYRFCPHCGINLIAEQPDSPSILDRLLHAKPPKTLRQSDKHEAEGASGEAETAPAKLGEST